MGRIRLARMLPFGQRMRPNKGYQLEPPPDLPRRDRKKTLDDEGEQQDDEEAEISER